MNHEELTRWFEAQKQTLETAYLAGTLPGFAVESVRSVSIDEFAMTRVAVIKKPQSKSTSG